MSDKYKIVQDIIDAEKIENVKIKDALLLSYFRGLSHCDNKEEIISKAFRNKLEEMIYADNSINK